MATVIRFSTLLLLLMTCSARAGLVAHWPLNLCSVADANNKIAEVVNGIDGLAVNNVTANGTGKHCQSGTLDGKGAHINIPHHGQFAVKTGGVSLWFKAEQLNYSFRPGRGGMALLSKDSNGTDNGGSHLTIWLQANGSLLVRHEDRSKSHYLESGGGLVSAQNWHHLSYTFGKQGMRLYLDGKLIDSNHKFKKGLHRNPEPIIIGANAWATGNNQSEPEMLADFFYGDIDEIKFFASQPSDNDVKADFNTSTKNCLSCQPVQRLLSHWPLDICAVSNTRDEIIDIVSGHHGSAVGMAAATSGKLCQAGRFDGEQAYLRIPAAKDFKLSNGSISFWLKPDALPAGAQTMTLFATDNSDGDGMLQIRLQGGGEIETDHLRGSVPVTLRSGKGTITQTSWHQVVYTFGTNGSSLYVDDKLVASSRMGRELDGSRAALLWGASSAAANAQDRYNGVLDDLKIYSYKLSASDVSKLYQQSASDCTNCVSSQQLFYRFEEDGYSGRYSVTDSSGSNQHGSAIGNVTTVVPDMGASCKVLNVPQNSRSDIQDLVETHLDLNALGSSGTISFWYRSHQPWKRGGQRVLLDASSEAAKGKSYDAYLLLSSDGRLEFEVSDTANKHFRAHSNAKYDVPANEWVHVALAWDLSDASVALYLNGFAQALKVNIHPHFNPPLAPFETLVLGDNRLTDKGNDLKGSANGQFDDFRVYGYAQSRKQVNADITELVSCQGVHHFQVEHDGQGLTCEAETLLVKACADAACTTTVPYATELTLAPLTTPITLPASSAGVEVNLRQTSPAVVTLSQTSAQPAAQYPLVCIAGAATESCQLPFEEAGLQIFSVQGSVVLEPQLAGAVFENIFVRAVRDQQGVCKAALNGEKSVQLAMQYKTPGSGTRGLVVEGNATAGQATLKLDFDEHGIAPLAPIQYFDAGEITLTAATEVQGAQLTSGATPVLVVPARLDASQTQSTQWYDAGADFSLAIVAQSVADASGQRLTLPNYQPGQLQFALYRRGASGAEYDGHLQYSAGSQIQSSADAAFEDVAIYQFNGGVYQVAAHYSEAGSIKLALKDHDYFGQQIDASEELLLGPFLPAYFEVQANQPELANLYTMADPFTYLGQPSGFMLDPEFTLKANNAQAELTRNYNDWSWLAPSLQELSVDDPQHDAGVALYQPATVSLASNNAPGQTVVTLEDLQVRYSRPLSPIRPFSADLNMTVPAAFFTDATIATNPVCFQTVYPGECADKSLTNIGGAHFRWGRLRLQNAFGPETEDKFVPLVSEYYVDQSRGFIINENDSLHTQVTVAASTVRLLPPGDPLQDVSGQVAVTADTITLMAGRATGYKGINIVKPQDGARGSVKVELVPLNDPARITWDDFLQFDWNAEQPGVQPPAALVSFGVYRGSDRIIHWREVF